MQKVFAMFPGQGSQFVGMGKFLLNEFPQAESVFEEASDAISVSIKKICLDGPDDLLRLTENTQPCLLTLSIAVWRVLQKESGFSANGFAGHSLGEYSALVASGRLAFPAAVRLVKLRGAAMQNAVPAGVGAMAAVLRFKNAKDVEDLCQKVTRVGAVVQPANYNSHEQIVISGHVKAVDQAIELAKELGAVCKKLPVSAPFHCSLMQPAKEVMRYEIGKTVFKDGYGEIIPNVSAEFTETYESDFLVEQITGAVRWTQALMAVEDVGYSRAVEIGPGKVLTGLAKRVIKKEGFQFDFTDEEGIKNLLT